MTFAPSRISVSRGILNTVMYRYPVATAAAHWLRCCATNRKVAGSIPAGVIGILHWHKILPIALWLWGRLSLQQKWVPGVFPGDKDGRYVRLTTLPPSCAVVMKSGNLNFLEPSGPLQACNGTAFYRYEAGIKRAEVPSSDLNCSEHTVNNFERFWSREHMSTLIN